MMESVNVLRKQDKCSDLPHVAAKNLVEGCRLLGIGVQVLGHLLGQQVTLLQGLHKVPANNQRFHNKTSFSVHGRANILQTNGYTVLTVVKQVFKRFI
jgi:hypothetical protein